MLLHDLIPSSFEAALLYDSNYGKQDLFSEWAPEKALKGCLQQGEFPRDLLIASNSYATSESDASKKRRKMSSAIVSSSEPETDKAPTIAVNYNASMANIQYNIGDTRACSIHVEKFDPYLGGFNGCGDSELLSASTSKELISSLVAKSKSEMLFGSMTRSRVSNMIECPDSELEVSGDNLSIRELCISVLRSHGLPAADWLSSNRVSPEIMRNVKNDNFLQSCELCGNFENALNMLLCDHCEGAFHVSCCNLNMDMLPTDEWFCQLCLKLNGSISLETSLLKRFNISWWKEKSNMGPIATMLKYREPYTSRVRIGASYQAAVPEWPDQHSLDFDCIGEPLEMNALQTICLHEPFRKKPLEPTSISNWLQCREVLHDAREGFEGTICGKWRRAPFSEIQTDTWDCSCSVVWDPSHSDCAVPQELETDEVLQQLKYVEQLRSRFAAKRRRIP